MSSSFLYPFFLAIPLALSTVPVAQAQASKQGYFVVIVCEALETSGTPIPDQTPEQTTRLATNFEQRAQSLGKQLGLPSTQIDADISRRRNQLVAKLRSQDPGVRQHDDDQTIKLSHVCSGLLDSDTLRLLNRL